VGNASSGRGTFFCPKHPSSFLGRAAVKRAGGGFAAARETGLALLLARRNQTAVVRRPPPVGPGPPPRRPLKARGPGPPRLPAAGPVRRHPRRRRCEIRREGERGRRAPAARGNPPGAGGRSLQTPGSRCLEARTPDPGTRPARPPPPEPARSQLGVAGACPSGFAGPFVPPFGAGPLVPILGFALEYKGGRKPPARPTPSKTQQTRPPSTPSWCRRDVYARSAATGFRGFAGLEAGHRPGKPSTGRAGRRKGAARPVWYVRVCSTRRPGKPVGPPIRTSAGASARPIPDPAADPHEPAQARFRGRNFSGGGGGGGVPPCPPAERGPGDTGGLKRPVSGGGPVSDARETGPRRPPPEFSSGSRDRT